jgi:hypothetical protein
LVLQLPQSVEFKPHKVLFGHDSSDVFLMC